MIRNGYCLKQDLQRIGWKINTLKKLVGDPDIIRKDYNYGLIIDSFYDVNRIDAVKKNKKYSKDGKNILIQVPRIKLQNIKLTSINVLMDDVFKRIEIEPILVEHDMRSLKSEALEFPIGHILKNHPPKPNTKIKNRNYIVFEYFNKQMNLYDIYKMNGQKFDKSLLQKLVFSYILLGYTNFIAIIADRISSKDNKCENMLIEYFFIELKKQHAYLARFFRGCSKNPIPDMLPSI